MVQDIELMTLARMIIGISCFEHMIPPLNPRIVYSNLMETSTGTQRALSGRPKIPHTLASKRSDASFVVPVLVHSQASRLQDGDNAVQQPAGDDAVGGDVTPPSVG
jgi:hypothetical protein